MAETSAFGHHPFPAGLRPAGLGRALRGRADGTAGRIRRNVEGIGNPHAGPSSRRSATRRADASQPAHPERGAHRPDRRRGEARPRRGRDGDPRAARCAGGSSSTACRSITRASACSSRATSWSGRSPTPRARSSCTTGPASRTPTSAATASTSCPGSSGLKVLDHRTGETRLANSTDFVEYVRLGDGLANIPYLATAFSTNADIEAQVSDAWRLYMTLTNSNKPVVSGRVHRARRAAHGRDDAALPARPGRPDRPPDVDLHDHRDRQLPVQRGLLPEPDRLRRGGRRGRDRAGHADGPDRAGDHGRGDGLPHRRRAGRDHHGPGHPAGRAGPVRRRAGHVPHEDRQLADVGDRGAPARRGVRRGRRSRSACRPSRTWPCRTARSSTRRPAPRRSAAR